MGEEGRFSFYDAYMENRIPNEWLKSRNVPLKDALLLFGWIHSWDPNFEGELSKFLEIYETIFPLMKGFEGKTILTLDFTDETKSSLSKIFDSLAYCCRTRRFESTDTSKALHGMLPELFVMWDDRIKKAIIGIRSTGRDYDGNCYAKEFLPGMQKVAQEFADSFRKERGGNREEAAKEISKMADGYTLAKLVDEINYLRFTKGRLLEDIRSEKI